MSNEEQEVAEDESGPIEFVGSLDAIMEAKMPANGKALRGGPIFERESIVFRMSSSTCTPGTFEGPNGEETEFKITVIALTHQEEIEATRTVKAPTDLPFMLAKRSLHKFNDKVLDDKRRGFLFEAMGPKGRQLILQAYGEVNAAGDEAVGKLHSDWEV